MADRSRTFPVTEPFELDGATYGVGDTVELRREAPKDFLEHSSSGKMAQ